MRVNFDEVYDTFGPELYRYLRRLTSSRTQAEDLLQETFLKLYSQLEAGREIQHVRAWLFRVATNLAKNHHLSQIRSALREERYGAPAPVIDFRLRVENQQIIGRALAKLSPRMRQVLLLFAEGFSYREIAEITGIEAPYVGVLLQRARAAFKQFYEEQYGSQYEGQDQRHSMRR